MHRRVDRSRARSRISAHRDELRGTLVYLTGGTTGRPRRVVYDGKRYGESVGVTAEILAAHGVGEDSRVVVCQPFDPWAIGGVFRDAALACGACVLPLGLSASCRSLTDALLEFDANVLCGSASLLLRIARSASRKA